jgi:hypothetical protein
MAACCPSGDLASQCRVEVQLTFTHHSAGLQIRENPPAAVVVERGIRHVSRGEAKPRLAVRPEEYVCAACTYLDSVAERLK